MIDAGRSRSLETQLKPFIKHKTQALTHINQFNRCLKICQINKAAIENSSRLLVNENRKLQDKRY